ncbi:hypothetical protein ACOME3_006378 [Neoechinorhynchus agilis]
MEDQLSSSLKNKQSLFRKAMKICNIYNERNREIDDIKIMLKIRDNPDWAKRQVYNKERYLRSSRPIENQTVVFIQSEFIDDFRSNLIRRTLGNSKSPFA